VRIKGITHKQKKEIIMKNKITELEKELTNALNKLYDSDTQKMKDRNGKDKVYSINGKKFNLVGKKDSNGNIKYTHKEISRELSND